MPLSGPHYGTRGGGWGMSYVALVTNRFDEVSRFYGELLDFPIVKQ